MAISLTLPLAETWALSDRASVTVKVSVGAHLGDGKVSPEPKGLVLGWKWSF